MYSRTRSGNLHWHQILAAMVGPMGREWWLQHLLASRAGLPVIPTVAAPLQGLRGRRVSCGVLSVEPKKDSVGT